MDKTPERGSSLSWGEGRIVFLAHKAEIEEKISQGWPLSKIYKEYQAKLGGLSYPGFTRSVRQYLGTATSKKGKTTEPAAPVAANVASKKETQIAQPSPMAFFQKGDRAPDAKKLI